MKNSIFVFGFFAIFVVKLNNCFTQNIDNKDNKVKETKFLHITEMGFLLGRQAPINNIYYPQAIDAVSKMVQSSYYYYPYYQNDNYNNFTFQHFSGYKINKAIALGITGAFDYYRANIITPLSLGIRSTILPSRRISPILNADFGYGFIWKNTADKENKIDKTGGMLLNPSAGIRIKVGNDGSQLNINVGYKLQKSKVVNDRPADEFFQTEFRSFNRLSIRLGLGF
jgi:hypothetical protein